jgi:hypothetical protein
VYIDSKANYLKTDSKNTFDVKIIKKRGSVKHKAQAALEFLMTYGWAIMVVLVAIGALAYFGVLRSDKLIPEKCILEPGIGCTDFKVQEDSIILVLRNGKGEDITISEITVGDCKGLNLGSLNNGEEKTYTITGCINVVNEKFIDQVNITYTAESGLRHKKSGNIVDKVEGGRVTQPGLFEWITTTQTEFDEGSYSTTDSIPAGSVQLSSSQSSGTYTSKVFDAGNTVNWDYIKWGEPIAYKEHIQPDGSDCASSSLKGTWYLDETFGSALDSSLCDKNGVNQGAITDVNGKIGKAYDFDGATDTVNLGPSNQKIFSSAPNELTGMAWIKPDLAVHMIPLWQGWGGQFWIGLGGDPPSQDKATMGVHLTTSSCTNYDGNWKHTNGEASLSPNNWYHIAGVYIRADNTIKVYADGVLHGTKTWTGDDAGECLSDPPSNHPPTIGASTTGSGYAAYFDGIIDEVAMYDRALLDSEILDIYKQGILNLYAEVRSCDDPDCNGESFSGSFTDATNSVLSSADNRYFQYRVNFESEDTSYTPFLEDVTVGYTMP